MSGTLPTGNSLPDGYAFIPKDALEPVAGGLKVGHEGVLCNEAGCWHARIRNHSPRRFGPRRWLWHAEIDARAPARYRRRAWLSATGTEVPEGCQLGTTCGDPHCISPYHLTVAARPLPPLPPAEGGRWGWIADEDGEGEHYGWLPDPAPSAPTAHPPLEPKCRARGERAGKSKLTADDVRAIRAAADGDRRHGSETSQKALAERYGITPAAVRKILTGRSWAHVK